MNDTGISLRELEEWAAEEVSRSRADEMRLTDPTLSIRDLVPVAKKLREIRSRYEGARLIYGPLPWGKVAERLRAKGVRFSASSLASELSRLITTSPRGAKTRRSDSPETPLLPPDSHSAPNNDSEPL